MIGDFLKGVGNQLDFIPGFDPDKSKQGLVSALMGINKPQPVNPSGMPPIVPGGIANPYQRYEDPMGFVQRLFTPARQEANYDAGHQAYMGFNAEAGLAEAQRAAEAKAAQDNRTRRISEGKTYGLEGRDLLLYGATGDLPEAKVVAPGSSVFANGQLQQAAGVNSVHENGVGQLVSHNNVSGQFGQPNGPVSPVSVSDGANLVNPVSGAAIHENPKDATSPSTVINNLPGQNGAPSINDVPMNGPIPAELFKSYLGRPPREGTYGMRVAATEENPLGITEVPFQGGAEANRLQARANSIQSAAATVLREAQRGLALMPNMAGYSKDGGKGTEFKGGPGEIIGANARIAASKIPGTTEFQFMQNIESARSNIGLDRLQQMRETSPTGGALGQVPVQQQFRLEQVLGSLDVSMPQPVMEENLKYLHNAYLDIAFGTEAERAQLLATGQMTPEDNNWIEQNYHDLNWDNFGNYQDPSKGGESVVGMEYDGAPITEDDILATMEATGKSRAEVESLIRKRAGGN